MQVSETDNVLMSKEELFNKIVTITGGRSAEEVIFNSITSGASNDIEQATKLARAMVTRLGMTEEFDMMATETMTNIYLGGDPSLNCSDETASKIDAKVLKLSKKLIRKRVRFWKKIKKNYTSWQPFCWNVKRLPARSLCVC